MAIATNVPQTNIPGRYASIDNSNALEPNAGTNYKILLIGTATAGSSGPTDTVVPIFSGTDGQQWGEGGMLDRMITLAKGANSSTPMYAIALAEHVGGTKATQAITVPTSTATANGTLHMYVGGQYTPVAVAKDDDEDAIAAAIGAAVTAKTSLPVSTQGVALNVATLETKFEGAAGGSGATAAGSIQIQFNRGVKEEFPPGVAEPTIVYTAGTNDPSITPAISAMVDVQYTHIVLPYEDTPNQDLMKTELDTRFGPEDQKWGVSFTAKIDTTANLLTYGASRNSQLQVTPEVAPGTASPLFECAAVMAAVAASEPDPAMPFQTLPLTGIVGAIDGAGVQRSDSERDSLLDSGIGTTKVVNGVVQIERFVTNYRENAAGAPDVSYKDIQTVLTVCVFRDAINARFAQKYARYKLGDDGNNFGAGQKVMTPTLARAEIVGVFETFVEAAILENVDQFKADLVVERSSIDKNRLEYSCAPDTINQLRVLAGVISFKL